MNENTFILDERFYWCKQYIFDDIISINTLIFQCSLHYQVFYCLDEETVNRKRPSFRSPVIWNYT